VLLAHSPLDMKRIKSVDYMVTQKYHEQHTATGLGTLTSEVEQSQDDSTSPYNPTTPSTPYYITKVRTTEDLEAIASLFIGYTEWLNIDLAYQDFGSELANLPGKYSPPKGELLLARTREGNVAIGCAALRPLFPPECCEIKRLYVAPAGRGLGVGKVLAKEILAIAKSASYTEVKLDTLPHMAAAIGLYTQLGFVKCEKYYDTPIEGTVFLSKQLS
jgi:ribosomal protein S18 acetylase RimI-like enzyme